MLGCSMRTTRDLLIPNTNELDINNQITQIKNKGKRDHRFTVGDGSILEKGYRKMGEN